MFTVEATGEDWERDYLISSALAACTIPMAGGGREKKRPMEHAVEEGDGGD